jgi:hypothetical protein
MRDLHVYIDPSVADALGAKKVFYSRRADGPYYRWRYEEAIGRWGFSRVRPSHLMLRALCTARWEAVPTALQARLDEHYLE